jgi:hypothetical protein
MDNLFLLVPISAHGFIDFIYLDNDLKLGLYVFSILFYGMICLKLFKDMSVIFFIIFSMYHFSKDFYYLDENSQLLPYCMGSLVITSTLSIKNKNQWNVILNLLTSSPQSTEKILHFLDTLSILSFAYILVNMFISRDVRAGVFIALYIRFFENTKPLNVIIWYLAFYHVPINVYKHYTKNKQNTTFLFLIGLIFSSAFCIFVDKKLNINIIYFALSVTTVHMILHAL